MSKYKYAYMDHWTTDSPRGMTMPSISVEYMDRYIKQLAGIGFRGLDTFGFRLPTYAGLFGSLKNFEQFLQARGIEKITSIFHALVNVTKDKATHIPETHDAIFRECEFMVSQTDELQAVDNFVVMPSATHFEVEPVTDEKIKAMADLWNRVGRMTRQHRGMKTSCHLEFWGAIRTEEQIEKFFEWTDPEYVYFFLDGAQHQIAGVDPVQLYLKYHSRCSGIHLKDTHNIDTQGDYRKMPDPEIMAPTTKRWFWEVGTPGGLVNYPLLMKAIKEYGYDGWITVEHDKADFGGSNFAESTCVAMWTIQNVLDKILED